MTGVQTCALPISATVFNLGYTEEVAVTYPWVKELSGGIASGHPRRRVLGKEANENDSKAA